MRACALALLVAALLAACGDDDDDTSSADAACPNDLPAACPSPAPTYADVAPLIEAYCFACHGPGGVEQAAHDFSTYDLVFAQRGSVLTQLYACRMPPPPEPPVEGADRAALLAWLVCGAPP